MEMSFRFGGEFFGMIIDKYVDDLFFLEEGMGWYEVGKDVIIFGLGIVMYKWVIMRGMLFK